MENQAKPDIPMIFPGGTCCFLPKLGRLRAVSDLQRTEEVHTQEIAGRPKITEMERLPLLQRSLITVPILFFFGDQRIQTYGSF